MRDRWVENAEDRRGQAVYQGGVVNGCYQETAGGGDHGLGLAHIPLDASRSDPG